MNKLYVILSYIVLRDDLGFFLQVYLCIVGVLLIVSVISLPLCCLFSCFSLSEYFQPAAVSYIINVRELEVFCFSHISSAV